MPVQKDGESSVRLSVVVPTYNQAALLRENLRSLVEQTLVKEVYEIVVVDDGSTDHTAAVLQEFGPPVKVVRIPTNRGRSAARNVGIRESLAPLIVLVDGDIIVRRDFLETHLGAHRREGPDILSRGPVIDVDNIAQARDGPVPRLAPSPAYLTTANAAAAKEALVRAGLFDERFPGYGWEDFDLGFRLKRLGIRRVFCKEAVAFHVEPADRREDIAALLEKEEARARSAVYLFRKHPSFATRLLIQATPVHRGLYWLQSGLGLLTPDNIAGIGAWLHSRGLDGVARFVLRGVLNQHYIQALASQFSRDAATPR